MCTKNETLEMISSSKDTDSSSKQQGNTNEGKIITKGSSSSSSPWPRLKDPRIVRVSRAFGGKDRHSKVCTIRGLRDRRVRLSVPTAIQLYDLQDRLGLNQPSKVVDWLLNAAKDEIDELPPLPVPSGNLGINHQEILSSNNEIGSSQSNKEVFRIDGSNINWEDAEGLPRSNIWCSDALWRAKSKEAARETVNEKETWGKGTEDRKQDVNEGGHSAEVSSINFLHRPNNSSLPSLSHNPMPFGSYYHLDPSNYPLTQLGSHGFTSQTEDLHNFNVVPLPSTLSLSSGSQILVCPPGGKQSLFPSHVEIDPRQINHFQMLSSSSHNLFSNTLSPPPHSISQSVRPFHFSMSPRILPCHSSSSGQPDKEQEFPSK